MEKSTEIVELANALCKFQSEMEPVIFDASNPFFKSKYATLANLVSMATPVATKYGLSVSQLTEDTGSVTTMLMHNSGQWLSSKLTLTPVKNDPQGLGSCITYARRYAYASILGLISEADDDGNKASDLKGHDGKEAVPAVKVQSQSLKDMVKMMGEAKLGDRDKFQVWRIDNNLPESLDKCTDFELARVKAALMTYRKA